MLSYCIELYCVEFKQPPKSYIPCIDLHYIGLYYILPEGLKNSNCKNIRGGWSGVGVGEAGLNRIVKTALSQRG